MTHCLAGARSLCGSRELASAGVLTSVLTMCKHAAAATLRMSRRHITAACRALEGELHEHELARGRHGVGGSLTETGSVTVPGAIGGEGIAAS
jgi:hypothetical protein